MKKALYCIVLVVMLFFITIWVKPKITIINNTDGVIYLFRDLGEQGREPEISEAEESTHPFRVKQGEHLTIRLPWRSLLLINGQFYLGWVTDSLQETKAGRTAHLVFNLKAAQGACAWNISVRKDRDSITPGEKRYCFSSVAPVQPELQ